MVWGYRRVSVSYAAGWWQRIGSAMGLHLGRVQAPAIRHKGWRQEERCTLLCEALTIFAKLPLAMEGQPVSFASTMPGTRG